MIQISDCAQMQHYAADLRQSGRTLALVPTMGALHDGHLALIDRAKQLADTVVMSIFVNPTQFGPAEDLDKYPRPLDRDKELAQQRGCDVVFTPTKEQMYPPGFCSWVTVEGVTDRLCGATRPGHFRGVTTVVFKLFQIVSPHVAVFGQKDAQQCVVIKRMVSDLNLPVDIAIAPTVREPDGLALSSRNTYLTPAERAAAPALFGALESARQSFDNGCRSSAELVALINRELGAQPLFSPEYIECVDPLTLQPLVHIENRALIAVACRSAQSKTRLIDNCVTGGSL